MNTVSPASGERDHTSSASPEALDVSVVIPMYNGGGTIGQQLESLACQAFSGSWEVVVADNGSTDHSIDEARRWSQQLPSLRIVEAFEKRGPAYARNVGTNAARGNLILYCDADDQVTDGWLEAMWKASRTSPFLAAREDHGTLGPRGSQDIRPSTTSKQQYPFLPWSRGGNIGVWTSVFNAVGGWDEKYTSAAGEDVDFCWRVQLAGYTLHIVEDAVMRYRYPDSWRAAAMQRFRFGIVTPVLFQSFAEVGAPQQTARDCLRDMYWVITRSPCVLQSRERRHMWIRGAAGRLGVMYGALLLRIGSARMCDH